MSNSSGQVVWRGLYEPFGKVTVTASGIPVNEKIRFPGQYYDQESGIHQNWWRDYNPKLGRYVEADLIGMRGGMNFYLYSHENPLNITDYFGLKPGDRFSTIQEAAIDALDYINPISISENREYAGWILEVQKGSGDCSDDRKLWYVAAWPVQGGPYGFDYNLPKPSNHAGAWYHTHGRGIPGNAGPEKFSPGDKKYSRDHDAIAYLGTPLGHILRYVPGLPVSTLR